MPFIRNTMCPLTLAPCSHEPCTCIPASKLLLIYNHGVMSTPHGTLSICIEAREKVQYSLSYSQLISRLESNDSHTNYCGHFNLRRRRAAPYKKRGILHHFSLHPSLSTQLQKDGSHPVAHSALWFLAFGLEPQGSKASGCGAYRGING